MSQRSVLNISPRVSLTKKLYVIESPNPLDLLACIEHSKAIGAPRPGLVDEAKESRAVGGHVEALQELFARSLNDGTFATYWTNAQRGRKFAEGKSLTTTKGTYRDLLTYTTYHDIDMINAQPTVLCDICRFLGFECDLLEDYLANREATLATIAREEGLTRKEAKKRICSLINGGGLEIDLYAKEDEANRPSEESIETNSKGSEVKVSAMAKHQKSCTASTKNKVACSKCHKEFVAKYIQKHEAKCKGARLPCRHCKKLKYSTQLEAHEAKCREREVACPKCEASMIYKNLSRHLKKCST